MCSLLNRNPWTLFRTDRKPSVQHPTFHHSRSCSELDEVLPHSAIYAHRRAERDRTGEPELQSPKANWGREIDYDLLNLALQDMGTYLLANDRDLTVVCIGGIVNVMTLRNRPVTTQVEILGSLGWLTYLVQRDLKNAKSYARDQSSHELSPVWLDHEIMIRNPDLRISVMERAAKQGVVVFQRDGLTVLAAPWEFAFCHTFDRWVSKVNARPDDLEDAAYYLNQWICANGNRPVRQKTVECWAQTWWTALGVAGGCLDKFNGVYRRLFGTDGVVLETSRNSGVGCFPHLGFRNKASTIPARPSALQSAVGRLMTTIARRFDTVRAEKSDFASEKNKSRPYCVASISTTGISDSSSCQSKGGYKD